MHSGIVGKEKEKKLYPFGNFFVNFKAKTANSETTCLLLIVTKEYFLI